ncbi:unnamed protein product [Effrenium voratum]|nr:unnamed protein product [Effrenium voratum]
MVDAELSEYFKEKYLKGELFEGIKHTKNSISRIRTYMFKGRDGDTQDLIILYHYTNELGFRNVGDLKQSAAQLFASLADDRTHFGQGVYTTQHECQSERSYVWGQREGTTQRDVVCGYDARREWVVFDLERGCTLELRNTTQEEILGSRRHQGGELVAAVRVQKAELRPG